MDKKTRKVIVREIVTMILIISSSNIIIDLTSDYRGFLERPVRFVIATIVLGTIGGYGSYRIQKWHSNLMNNQEDGDKVNKA